MGDVNLEIKLSNLDERVIKIEESGGGSGGDDYITSVSNDFNVVNKKLSLSNNITTKLSKVDTTDNLSVELAKKINKPASATDGQVLTYNGTSNEWEAQDSKGGAGDTSIISDAYDELKTYSAGEYCIYNNLLWKCLVQNNGQTPTEGTHWTNVSVVNEIASVNSSLTVIGNETELYYATPNNANNTIPNLSQFREIRFETMTISEGYIFNSITLSVDKFKTLYSGNGILQLSTWLGSFVVLGARYINDTTIYVVTNNTYWYLRVIGIK